jgi:uncharacterized protein (DUF302 family)
MAEEREITTKTSPRSVSETVDLLVTKAQAKAKVFAVIDQRAEALAVGLELRETTLVLFGNPAFGTGIMVASPLSALDLPLKVLVWADGDQTKVSYESPRSLASRLGLGEELFPGLAQIDALTDMVVD